MSFFSSNNPGQQNAKQSKYGYKIEDSYAKSGGVNRGSEHRPITAPKHVSNRLQPMVLGGSLVNGLTIQGTQEYNVNDPQYPTGTVNSDVPLVDDGGYNTLARPKFPIIFNTKGVPTISQGITIKNIVDGTTIEGGIQCTDEATFESDIVCKGDVYAKNFYSEGLQTNFTPILAEYVSPSVFSTVVVLDTVSGVIHGSGQVRTLEISMTWSAQAFAVANEDVRMGIYGIPILVNDSFLQMIPMQGISNPFVSGQFVGKIVSGTGFMDLFCTSSSSFDAALNLTAHDFGYQNGTGNLVDGHLEIYAPIAMQTE